VNHQSNIPRWLALTLSALCLLGCGSQRPPIHTVPKVDLQRFMGPWYVIANIPTFIEKGAHNAIESYQLNADGTIATTFTFREGSFEGPEKRHEPTGFVTDTTSNAIWDMQFFWPFKSDYRIVYLSEDYGETIIGREARDYLWIMARTPKLPEAKLQQLIQRCVEEGYDPKKIERVPQNWGPK
jgi:apolipoprotein D and lipocalin family protein